MGNQLVSAAIEIDEIPKITCSESKNHRETSITDVSR